MGEGQTDDAEINFTSAATINDEDNTEAQVQAYEWTCAACTFLNNPEFPKCDMCNTPRPEQQHHPPAPPTGKSGQGEVAGGLRAGLVTRVQKPNDGGESRGENLAGLKAGRRDYSTVESTAAW